MAIGSTAADAPRASAVDYHHLHQLARRGGTRRGAPNKAAKSPGGESG